MKLREFFYLMILGVCIFASGLGVGWGLLFYVGFGGLVLIWLGELSFERLRKSSFCFLLLFVFVVGLSWFWSVEKGVTLRWFWYFAAGSGFYGAGLFLKGVLEERLLKWLVVVVGLLWSGVFLINQGFLFGLKINLSNGFQGMVRWVGDNHLHLGDWFVLIVLIGVSRVLGKKKDVLGWVLSLVGLGVVVFSKSRSAYVAFLVGFLVLLKSGLRRRWFRRVGLGVLVVLLGAFVVVGRQKSMVLNRIPYVFSAGVGLIRYPLGLGMGNYRELANELYWEVPEFLQGVASSAHGILMEIAVGMGWLGVLSFLLWLVFYWKRVRKEGLMFALWLSMGVNMVFDNTYFIGAYWWFFMFLSGWLERRKKG